MKVVSVVGARPQFVKLAPVALAMEAAGVEHFIVHTGQHYDKNMSDIFFEELNISEPDINLAVGSGTHAGQTAQMLLGLEDVMVEQRPDWVLTYGDTNSTLAAAVAAVKLHLPTAHLEAGLRSFNRRMPEEHNRVLTDHASDLLLAPSQLAMDNLSNEGLGARASRVGDVMVDVVRLVEDSFRANPPTIPVPDGDFVLATIHRAENTDDVARLTAVVEALHAIAVPVVLPAHPRLRRAASEAGLTLNGGNVRVVEPLSYRDMVAAVSAATSVVTDSGGLQKEAFVLGTPCATVRSETEWPETLESGWNVLVSKLEDIPTIALRQAPAPPEDPAPYGRGDAASRAVEALERSL